MLKSPPARLPQLGTRPPILHHDGRDLAAALQTIIEIGDPTVLNEAISDAFPEASLQIAINEGRFTLQLHQHGLLRLLSGTKVLESNSFATIGRDLYDMVCIARFKIVALIHNSARLCWV